MRSGLMMILMAGMLLAGCDQSGGTPATAPAAGAGEKLKEDMKELGHDIKDAATQAATEMKPAYQAATQKGRELLHEGAEKVAGWTETQPGTRPVPK